MPAGLDGAAGSNAGFSPRTHFGGVRDLPTRIAMLEVKFVRLCVCRGSPSIRKWREMMRERPKLKAYFAGPGRRDKVRRRRPTRHPHDAPHDDTWSARDASVPL